MRLMRLIVVTLVSCAVAVAWSAPVASGKPNVRVVQVRDKCDPATFNAVLGPGICVEEGGKSDQGRFGPGNVTFAEFAAKLNPRDFGHHQWRFNPERTKIRTGDTIAAVNRGGEDHTFSEVAAFGAGCVDELNEPLGLHGPPVVDCAAAFTPDELIAPGETKLISGLSPGTHRFICAIHPWMVAEVEVRR